MRGGDGPAAGVWKLRVAAGERALPPETPLEEQTFGRSFWNCQPPTPPTLGSGSPAPAERAAVAAASDRLGPLKYRPPALALGLPDLPGRRPNKAGETPEKSCVDAVTAVRSGAPIPMLILLLPL
ncbi:hypothetical protein NDU88_008524 [Pleurodeles waltl]|uniref:Uncharacterized protein n=1 Tax=Pleurodeles waltl TaxID=8319 RepID=A0AAV7NZH4_PLEWA|nr:hypothetical protein NDU88_008524 [Pleurodeles waltl]